MRNNNYGVCRVGLGIVAEMEKTGEIPATRALFLQNIWRSSNPNPIPVTKPKTGELHFSSSASNSGTIFDISPARYSPPASSPASDFLNSCHLCKKKLHGKDVYIYGGEKGFCSSECRYRQIVMEEKKEKSSSSSISSSGYSINGGQIILSPEILAT